MDTKKDELYKLKKLCYERGFHDATYLGRKNLKWLEVKPKQTKSKKKICKHKWQIFPRPERFEYSLGDFVAVCNKCFEKRFI